MPHTVPHLVILATSWRHLLAEYGPLLLGAVSGLVLTAAATAQVIRARRNKALARGARLIEISPPPEAEDSGGQTLWANLLGLHRPGWHRALFGQEHIGFEYAATGEGLSIRIWIPEKVAPGLVEQAVEAAWPGARTRLIETYPPPVPPGGVVEGGRLVPARTSAVPLRVKFDTDPLRPLLGTFAALGHGENGCVQILARPASPRRARKLRRSLAGLSGKPTTSGASLGRTLAAIGPGPAPKPAATYNGAGMRWRDARTDADARAAAGKLAGPLWEAEIRYAAATTAANPAAGSARARGLAHQLASAMNVFAERNHLRRRRLPRPAEQLAWRRFGRGALYSVAELAAFAHLPTDQVVPGLARAGARSVPPSIRIPASATAASPVKLLGDADAGPARAIALPVADARHHLHVVGATGSGKSTLLANLVLADIEAGRGAVVIDPKGDLVADLLDRLPAQAADRTVLFDPEDATPPPRINMFDGVEPDVAVDHLTGIFKKIYAGFWGPRTDDLLRAACLTLIIATRNDPSLGTPTLADIPDLLVSDQRRARYLTALRSAAGTGIEDFSILNGFWAWYQQLSVPARGHVTAPLLNKLRAFLLRDFAAQAVATGATSIDLRAVLDGGICLVRLPKGVLGEETVRLLGSFVVAKCWQAATSRARLGTIRRDATLAIDECQNFLTLSIGLEEMLAEARGYRLSFVLANQNLAQMPPDLREGVSANARNKLIFSVSPEDAARLERHTLPNLTAHDLANLDAFQAAGRLTVASAEQPACTLTTRPMPKPIPGRAAAIRAAIAARPTPETAQISPVPGP